MPAAKIIDHQTTPHRETYIENPRQHYDNLHKKAIMLYRGEKKGSFLRHVPDDFCPPETKGYALLRGFNCQACCHYCFLQTYFKSPDMVKFTNIDAYLPFLEKFIFAFQKKYGSEQRLVFFDGDFHDSLGYVGLREDIEQINLLTDFFSQFINVYLEIKTKCIIDLPVSRQHDASAFFERFYSSLLIRSSLLTAITFSPQEVIDLYEPGTASLQTRVAFASYIAARGGLIGPRIDPLLLDVSSRISEYSTLVALLQNELTDAQIYNWRIGALRIKPKLYKQLRKAGSPLITHLIAENGFRKYPHELRQNTYAVLQEKITHSQVSICMERQSSNLI